MEDRAATQDSYSILGIPKSASIKDICKAYKSLAKKWHPDKNPSNKKEAEAKFTAINEAYMELNKKKVKESQISKPDDEATTSKRFSDDYPDVLFEDSFFSRLSKSTSKRSPSPSPASLSRTSSKRSPSPSPSSILRTTSKRSPSPSSLSKTSSVRSPSPSPSLSRTSSRMTGSTTPTTPNTPTDILSPSSTPSPSSMPSPGSSPMPRSTRRTTNPIIFSQSTTRRKAQPIEKKLECSLEELCRGCVKKIKITRDVIRDTGLIAQDEEILRIKIKPGWKQGTKITFEGKGDEKPGYLPADIIFIIEEKKHPLFKRDGDDLEVGVEVPLVKALTGYSFQVPLLGEETMHLHVTDIIYPGYEKIIRGQGMPKSKEEGRRGDLRIKFIINFPTELSEKQRASAASILQGCC